jgi:hypothetical protein
MPSEPTNRRCTVSGEDLLRYYLGCLDGVSVDEIDQHLRRCSRCRAKLIALELGATLHETREAPACLGRANVP